MKLLIELDSLITIADNLKNTFRKVLADLQSEALNVVVSSPTHGRVDRYRVLKLRHTAEEVLKQIAVFDIGSDYDCPSLRKDTPHEILIELEAQIEELKAVL